MKLNQQPLRSRPWKLGLWLSVSVVLSVAIIGVNREHRPSSSQQFKSETQVDEPKADSELACCFADSNCFHSFPQGTWVVDSSPWNFQCQTVSEREVGPLMKDAPSAPALLEGSSQPVHQVILDLFPATKAVTRTDGGLAWRSLDLGTVRACVCYRVEGSSIVHSTVAHRMLGDQWQVVQLTPNTHHNSVAVHLLPMLDNCQSQCKRLSDRGELQCEILDTDQTLEELLAYWMTNGWSVMQDQSDSKSTNQGWICSQGSLAIRVQLTTSANKRCSLILTALHQLKRN